MNVFAISYDGKVFNTLTECEEYEGKKKCGAVTELEYVYNDMIKTFEKLDGYSIDYCDFAMNCSFCSSFNLSATSLAERLVGILSMFAINNSNPQCRTLTGIWDYVKEHKSFGDIVSVFYMNDDGDLVRLWE